MNEPGFEKYLLEDDSIVSKTKGVRSRLNKGRMIERHFGLSLDEIVCDDDKTYKVLLRIKEEMKDINGTLSNALRKYYTFINDKAFPALSEYKES